MRTCPPANSTMSDGKQGDESVYIASDFRVLFNDCSCWKVGIDPSVLCPAERKNELTGAANPTGGRRRRDTGATPPGC
jgi:hypothetical protein